MMAKKKKTAKELAALIAGQIGAAGADVKVQKDPALGWHPTVYTKPGHQAPDLQRRAKSTAAELRALYDLAD